MMRKFFTGFSSMQSVTVRINDLTCTGSRPT